MTIKNSPLQLRRCSFTRVEVDCNPTGDNADLEKIVVDVEIDCSQHEKEPRTWHVALIVQFKPADGAKAPFSGSVENIGTFTVAESWAEDQMRKLVYINGAGILYASVREMVATITARTFFDTLTLPSCSFNLLYKEQEEPKASETAPKS